MQISFKTVIPLPMVSVYRRFEAFLPLRYLLPGWSQPYPIAYTSVGGNRYRFMNEAELAMAGAIDDTYRPDLLGKERFGLLTVTITLYTPERTPLGTVQLSVPDGSDGWTALVVAPSAELPVSYYECWWFIVEVGETFATQLRQAALRARQNQARSPSPVDVPPQDVASATQSAGSAQEHPPPPHTAASPLPCAASINTTFRSCIRSVGQPRIAGVVMRLRFGGLWRHPDFRKLWMALTISLLGSQVTALALPLTAALTLGATQVQMGVLGALEAASWFLFGPVAGVWVDRRHQRPIPSARAPLMICQPMLKGSARTLRLTDNVALGNAAGVHKSVARCLMHTISVTFLGSGDAFGSGGRYQTCIFVDAGAVRLLLDCGASSLSAMKRWGVDPASIDVILITHLHGDHFGGLPFVLLEAQLVSKRSRPLLLAGPPGLETRVRAAMEVFFPGSERLQPRFAVTFRELAAAVPTDLGSLVVTPQEVIHASGAPAYALRVDCAGKTIAYSGDTEWTDALRTIADSADLFICEAYFFDRPVKYHLDYQTLASHRAELGCHWLVVTHMSDDMLARVQSLDIDYAEDGKQIAI